MGIFSALWHGIAVGAVAVLTLFSHSTPLPSQPISHIERTAVATTTPVTVLQDAPVRISAKAHTSDTEIAPTPTVVSIASNETAPVSSSRPVAPTSSNTPTPQYSAPTNTSGCTANQTLPDPDCSPGAVLTTDTSVICVVGYTKTVRNVSDSERQQVFAEYGIDYSLHSGYEVDHIISLELGGSNDIANLYPESYTIQYNAHVKDTFENYLHSQICSNKIPVAVAQTEIATDWLKYYLAWKNGTNVPPPAVQVTATPTPVTTTQTSSTSGAAYYTSSYGSSKYYYPASCSAWKTLSSKYLVSFPSLDALLTKYPSQTLSPQCQ
jgi:hypothetical protein